MKIDVPENLRQLMAAPGSKVYIVGGYVRNALCGLGETDIDLTGPLIATALTLPKGAYVKVVNFRLGTAIIGFRGQKYEYTPFRIEKYAPGGGHTPSEVRFTTDLKADAARRDFAANSIYYDLETDKLIDPLGGVADVQRGILRSADPEAVFASDGLRILRLARIAAETGFKIDGATATAAMAHADYLKDISPERKAAELLRILTADIKYGVSDAHYRGLKLCVRLGLMQYLLPCVAAMEGVEQNPKYHKFDVLEHTLRCVKFAQPDVRLAALLHDAGKPVSLKLYGNMHGHEKLSESVCREALGQRGLKLPLALINETARLCLYHMYDMSGETSEAKVRLFVAKNTDIIDKLVRLIRADRLATGMESQEEGEHRFITVKNQLIAENAPIELSDLAIGGEELMQMGYTGNDIGSMLSQLQRECILQPQLNRAEWLSAYAAKRLPK